jgi:hypothetical protein
MLTRVVHRSTAPVDGSSPRWRENGEGRKVVLTKGFNSQSTGRVRPATNLNDDGELFSVAERLGCGGEVVDVGMSQGGWWQGSGPLL